MILYLDTETYSAIPIARGVHAYAEGVEIMVATYAIDDGPVEAIEFPARGDLEELIDGADIVVLQNSHFDRTVMRHALGVQLSPSKVYDTMVGALAHSLPGSLSSLCDVLGVAADKSKDKAGKQLIQLFCKPQPAGRKIPRATKATHPEEWARFLDYAKSDISSMREVYKKLPRWNYDIGHPEHRLWQLDQLINDRGFAVDTDLVAGAIRAVTQEKARLADCTVELTDGELASTTQRDATLLYVLKAYGWALPDLKADTVERALSDDEIPADLRELLRIRLQASTSSTAKYKKLTSAVSKDGRLRGSLQFAGAMRTARWAGRVFQPHNLPRPTIKRNEVEMAIDAMKLGCEDLVTPNIMDAASAAIRGCIVSSPGKKLIVADLSAIEGRVAAWLAGEEWKLQAFRDYDDGIGPDLYCVAYGRAFNVDPLSIDKETSEGFLQRQIGKVMELMLQYEGGVGAFLTGAETYGIDLDAMAIAAYPTLPEWVIEEASNFWVWQKKLGNTHGLSRDVFIVCDALKRLWRAAHPHITGTWPALRDAAIGVVHGAEEQQVGLLSFSKQNAWLKMRLPSGRFLCYPSPRFAPGKRECSVCTGKGLFQEDERTKTCPLCEGVGEIDDNRSSISYMGVNQFSRRWDRIKTYGGKLFENATQAAARDVLALGMEAAEAAGYELVLTVHDENLTECPDTDDYDADTLAQLMTSGADWTAGLPLAAEGFEAKRYRK